MDLIYLKINRKNCSNDVGSVLSKTIIRQTMGDGAWIAGGFARVVAHNIFNIDDVGIKEYLVPDRNKWGETSSVPGDVDIFSPVNVDLSKYTDAGRRSFGDFALDSSCIFGDETYEPKRYTVQLVDHPKYRYNNVESCLESFDIINSRYAIVLKDNAYYLVYDKEALWLDKNGCLNIAHTSGPFLAARVLKYLTYKKCYNGITQEGYKKLTEWFIRASSGSWPDHFHGQHLTSIRSHIHALQSRGYMEIDNLVLFLGKWRHQYRKEKYGPIIDIDWAVDKIDKMSLDE
jgi:hypothetical protein